jgi:hypothetical protein
MKICLENQYINDIDYDHYIDNGCFCKYCKEKRKEIYFKAKAGDTKFDKIIHRKVVNEVKIEKINNKLTEIISLNKSNRKFNPLQFKIKMTNK